MQFLGLAQKKMFRQWCGYYFCSHTGQKCWYGFDEKTFGRDGGGYRAVPVGWSRRIASQKPTITDGKRTIAYNNNIHNITTVFVLRRKNFATETMKTIICFRIKHDDRDCVPLLYPYTITFIIHQYSAVHRSTTTAQTVRTDGIIF